MKILGHLLDFVINFFYIHNSSEGHSPYKSIITLDERSIG